MSKRKLAIVLLTAVSLAIAAVVARLFFAAAGDYYSYLAAVKFYCILWASGAVLSLLAGIRAANPVALTASALGFATFATICILDPNSAATMPMITLAVEIAAPALFTIAWVIVTAAAFLSSVRAVRGWAWIWLTFTLTLALSYGAYNYGRYGLYRMRNEHLMTAAINTVRIAEQLEGLRQAQGVYPASLESSGLDPALFQLPYRNQTVKYFGSRAMFILTFEDPLYAGAVVYSWDTSKGGWYPADPAEATGPACHNIFLGELNP